MLLALTVVLAYYVKGVCGFGNTLVFTSIAGLRTDISQLTPLDLLVGFVPNALIVWRDRKNACFRIWGPLALMVLAGDIPGALLLKYGDAHILKIGFGVLVILLALDMLLQREKKPIGKVPSILLGIVAGLVCGMYGVGALAAAYVSRATDSNESYRGSLCIVFTLDNLFRIALYFATGILNLEIAAWALQLLPMMLIGLTAGIWTVKKVSPDWIRRAVILALIVSGAALIINNI